MMVINLTDFSEKSDQMGYIHNEAQNALALMELAANYSSWSTRCKKLAEYCFGNAQREIQRLPSEKRSADEVQELLASISQQLAVFTVGEGDSNGKACATYQQQPPRGESPRP